MTIREGVARDRVPSTVDPDMRHGRKSSAGRFTGYKLTVTVEPKSHIITNVKAHHGNSHDGGMTKDVVTEQKDAGLEPAEVMGDTAYGGADLRHEMNEVGVTMVAPAPAEPEKGRTPKSAFAVDLEQKECRCPAGQVTHDYRTNREDGHVKEFRFAPKSARRVRFGTNALASETRVGGSNCTVMKRSCVRHGPTRRQPNSRNGIVAHGHW